MKRKGGGEKGGEPPSALPIALSLALSLAPSDMLPVASAQSADTGAPLRKLITAPNLPLKHGNSAEKTKLSDANVARNGFTKYVREGKGRYVKTAGHDSRAPRELHP